MAALTFRPPPPFLNGGVEEQGRVQDRTWERSLHLEIVLLIDILCWLCRPYRAHGLLGITPGLERGEPPPLLLQMLVP